MTRAEWDHWGQGGTFTLFAILYIFVGVQLLAVGVMGEYVGRIYGQVRRRPRFVVREFHGDEWSAKTVVPARVGLTPAGAAPAVNPRSQVGSRPPDAGPSHPRP
jgi:hypothetical protein